MPKPKEIVDNPDRIFIVGDIHGCPEETEVLVKHIIDKESLSKNDQLIFIGDYVDRGPDSKSVVDFLIGVKNDFPKTIFLCGNHEDMMLDFMGYEGSMGNAYLFNGGLETLQSYGVKSPRGAGKQLKNLMPEDHLEFYLSLDNYVLVESFALAHAGLNPLRDLRNQIDTDLYWIREAFIDNPHYFDCTVIFGHTPYENVFFDLPFKIGIDTGLVYGNILTCIELKNEQIFQVESGDNDVIVGVYHSQDVERFKGKQA